MNDEIISVEEVEELVTQADPLDVDTERACTLALASDHGERLDKVLVQHWPNWSRSWLQHLIEQGEVRLSGAVVNKASSKVRAGDRIEVRFIPTAQASAFIAQQMNLEVVFEDEQVMVINKAAGMVVHPAAGHWHGTILNGLLAHHERAKTLPRAGIVHRLDKDTSGLMVIGKTTQACESLVHQIAQRQVQRVYVALAHAHWKHSDEIQINRRIGRDHSNRLRMAGFDPHTTQGKSALTQIRLLGSDHAYSWVTCKLHTGRTHQIRVHLADLGHPLVADVLYGGKAMLGLERQALHAAKLAFEHPSTGQWMTFNAPLPADIACALSELGLNYTTQSLWVTQAPNLD